MNTACQTDLYIYNHTNTETQTDHKDFTDSSTQTEYNSWFPPIVLKDERGMVLPKIRVMLGKACVLLVSSRAPIKLLEIFCEGLGTKLVGNISHVQIIRFLHECRIISDLEILTHLKSTNNFTLGRDDTTKKTKSFQVCALLKQSDSSSEKNYYIGGKASF